MADIQGMSIGLDLDTMQVERGLTGLKDRLRSVNSEMKANMSAFDRSDQSIGKYETRLSGLNKKLETQKRVTDEAKNHYTQMVDEHGRGSTEAEKAERAYNNQAAALNNLERYVGNATKELEEMKRQQKIANSGWTKTGNKLQETGSKITDMGGKLNSFGKKWTKVTSIAAGAVAGLGAGLYAFTSKVAKGADEIQNNADKANMSAESYQEWNYWAKQNGIEQSTFNKIVQRSNQRISEARNGNEKYTEALKKMGFNQEEINNMDTSEMYEEIIQKLQGMDDESEKVALATEFFGKKTARELLPALKEGATAFSAAQKEAHEYGIILTDDQIEASQEFIKAQDSIKAALGGIAAQIGMELLPYFSKMLNWVQSHIPEIKETISNSFDAVESSVKSVWLWFKNLSPEMKKAAGLFAGVAAAIGPVSIALGAAMKIFGPFTTAVGKGMAAIGKFGGLLPAIKVGLTALTGPVGLTVAAIAGLTAGFITAYKKSETFRNIIHGLKDAFLNAVSGIKNFLTTNGQIQTMLDAMKTGFRVMKSVVSQAIGAVVSFFKEKIAQMKAFWDSEGQDILQAFKNIFSGIKAVVSPVLNFLVSIFEKTFPILQKILGGAFKIMLSIVKSVWSNIKGIIDGGLQVIQGLIKTFSGIFTGDFSNMWSGIKDIFSGAIKILWNWVQLNLFGKLLKLLRPFAKTFKNIFSKMWSGIKNVFSTVIKWAVNFVKNRFTSMKNTVTSITTGIKNIISKIWNSIKSTLQTVIKSIVNFGENWFNTFKSNLTTVFNAMKNITKSSWNTIKKFIVNPIKSGVNWAIKKFTGFKNSVTDTFKNIKDNVFGYVSDMIQKIKDMPGNMKDKIVSGAGKMKEGFLDLGQAMINGIKKGVDGVLTAVNWVLEKFTNKKDTFGMWDAPVINEYAKGTKGAHPGGPAYVGDGKGSNKGSELMRDPKGNFSLSPNKPTLIPNMPKGTQVWSATETREALAPQYAWGINLKDTAKALNLGGKGMQSIGEKEGSKTKQAFGKAASASGSAIDVYNDAPKTLFNAATKALGIEVPDFTGVIGDMAKGGFNYLKKKSYDFISGKQEEYAPDLGGIDFGSAFTKSSGYGNRGGGFHKGIDFAAETGTPIPAQTGGKVIFSGSTPYGGGYGGYGQTVHIKGSNGLSYLYAHNSRNLAKTGDSVSKGQVIGMVGSTGQSTGPHVHFETRKNGKAVDPNSVTGGGGAGKWRSQIKKAATQMNETINGSEINGIMAQIKRESEGNQKAIQSPDVVDVNTLAGNPARGLLQYIPRSFNSYKAKGHGNIMSGYDQLLAFFNNSNWRTDLPYGTSGWGPTGARKYKQGTNYVPEDGPAYLHKGEAVVPEKYNKPARTDAMKMLALAAKDIDKKEKDKQSNDLSDNGNQIANKLDQLIELMQNMPQGDIHFYDKKDSPSDSARKVRKAQQQWALGMR